MTAYTPGPGSLSGSRPWPRMFLFLLLVWWTFTLGTGISSWCFVDFVNLAFHEAGHLFFGFAGKTIRYLGGTLGQMLVPGLLCGYFLIKERQPFAASVCAWWWGQNLITIAIYMADARSLALPLVGAGHAPHQVEKEWVEPYRGQFDSGWDAYREAVLLRQVEMGIVAPGTVLAERDPDVPAWDSLSEDEQRMYARQMETYAGFLTQTDHHFGRIISYLDKIGESDNTIVAVISDNGPSAEGGVHGTFNEMLFFNGTPETLEDNMVHFDDWGGVDTFPHYSWGWTWAGATPFRRWKRETYRGGISDPFILSWPAGISDRGSVRSQYAHAIDIVPTLLEALEVEPPSAIGGVAQSSFHGVSFASSFDDADVDSLHKTQYFEMFGHRSIYHENWRAVCPFPGPSFAEAAEKGRYFGGPLTADVLADLDENAWELYDLNTDPTETTNVAEDHPQKLTELIELWYEQADRYGVLPLATADMARMNVERPSIARPRTKYIYQPGGAAVPFAASPRRDRING